jgi:DNA-binding FadR family transcriptional regulator
MGNVEHGRAATSEHQTISDMTRDHNQTGAEQAMRLHLKNSRTRLLAAYDQD